MVQHFAELGDLLQGGVPIGGNYRDATVQRFEVLQDLPSVESA
jgi:hypothetical protein